MMGSDTVLNEYEHNGIEPNKVSKHEELSVIISFNLGFNKYLDKIMSKAYRMLGFIYRLTNEINDDRILSHLYSMIMIPSLSFWLAYAL